MNDPTSQLRSATRRAKSDVANKLISMFLHDLSRRISRGWNLSVESEEYGALVRQQFKNQCPYCLCALTETNAVVEHLDGMNRYRAGLHVPGNVLIACKRCNGEKRRDDSRKILSLDKCGWSCFLSHDGTRCDASCATCQYWMRVWPDDKERRNKMAENLQRLRSFRSTFPKLEEALNVVGQALPDLLTRLYSDCQNFAQREIQALLKEFEEASSMDFGI